MNSKIDLDGVWDIFVDDDRVTEKYDGVSQVLDTVSWGKIDVPGCWEAAGVSKIFSGPVWYRKKFVIPAHIIEDGLWILKFESVSYYCEVYINGVFSVCHEGLWDSFHIDITQMVHEGENTVALKIYKPGYADSDRFHFRETITGFVPDVCSTFGGIWGHASIEEKPPVYIENVFVEPDVDKSTATVNASICSSLKESVKACIETNIKLSDGNTACSLSDIILPAGSKNIKIDIKINAPILWDIDNPYLYTAKLCLKVESSVLDAAAKRFGMRKINTEGQQILLNGKPVYLRGMLHWGYYPDKICPNPDRESIINEIKIAKKMGFNTIKQCLYVPKDEYYNLADEMGMLMWQELPVWLPRVTQEFKGRMMEQYPRLIRQLAGHPSLIIYTLGCEMDSGVDGEVLEKLYDMTKKIAGNVLVRDNSGSGECYGGLAVDFADFYDYHFYADLNNIENLMEVFTPNWREKRPWLYGEFCDSDTYRDVRELPGKLKKSELWWLSEKMEDNPLRNIKKNIPVLKQESLMAEGGILNDSKLLKDISLKQSLLHRKFTIESTRQFPEISGYVITCIRDVPITTSGIFDDMMQPKFSPEDYKKFNNDVVLLPAWDLKRTWENGGDRVLYRDRYNYWCGEDAGIHVLISNYSRNTLKPDRVYWEVTRRNGEVVYKGVQEITKKFQPGSIGELMVIRFKAPELNEAEELSINVTAECREVYVKNEWKIWVYPKKLLDMSGMKAVLFDPSGILAPLKNLYSIDEVNESIRQISADVVVTTMITPSIEKYLLDGGKVFYVQRGEGYLPSKGCPFWREAVKRLYDHEILKEFPHNDFCDLQFFGLSPDSAIDTLNLRSSSITEVNPIIRRVDAREFTVLDYMVELKMGKGTMIASSLRFEGGMGKQPNNLSYNTAGVFLIDRVLRYLAEQ